MALLKHAMVFIVYLLVVVVEFSDCFSFNCTVSLDGTGNFVKVNDAIAAAPNFSTTRFYIHVKRGIYKEIVEVPSQKTFIALIGDDASTTIIVNNRSNATGFTTATTATLSKLQFFSIITLACLLAVNGENFMAQFLTFENSAGPKGGQAIAVVDQAKHTAYYKCVFLGYQDTLFAASDLQFFKECDIYGSIDFIFGNGLTIFQDCNIFARLPSIESTVTAQSKNRKDDPSGFVFQNCNVTVSSEIASSKDKVMVFLGRPWRKYSMVIFIESFLDDVVQPKGWLEWPGVPTNLLFYAEYNNRGAGANTSQRVNWPGFHVLHNAKDVASFTVETFINGTQWLPETSIPFRAGV
ncbi:probable pectinesterase/pectinesterase inhibitor 39 [Benincasa hispida]|uniref:probable pectinesterase/pectinesterase inhibitor 39 n=1 Tax=Benincasa hispida TaxID=102211 RepID=UPI0018FFE53C|nr:probable pectinesterase/pectinesterase inhibitor 39 [Benincasa hispida]